MDIGGVIIKPASDSGDTSFFSSGFLQTPQIEDAFETLFWLNTEVFQDKVFLVSKAKLGTAKKTRQWLHHHNFFAMTGITEDKLYFVEKRPDKARIAKKLQLTAFIDDRLDVLHHLEFIPNRILFIHEHNLDQNGSCRSIQSLIGWSSIKEYLLSASEN